MNEKRLRPAGDQRSVEVVLLTSGHTALDHRIFSKQARSLANRFSRVRVVGVHPRDETLEGIEVRALRPYRSRAERFLVCPLRCFLGARGVGPRVLILHDAELLPWVPVTKLVTDWKVIYDVHEDFSNLLLRRTWLPRPLKRLVGRLGRVEKWLASRCDGVMAVTQTLVDGFDHPRRVAVYNLPSSGFIAAAAAASLERPERDVDLVHLGTLSEERLLFLVDVIRRIAARRPETSALIIGLRPEQVDLVRRDLRGVDVETHGQLPYDAIPAMLARCRIGVNVHPILYPHLRCAVPVKVFEYMASGCSVVTSHLPELSRLLGDDAVEFVVTVLDPSPEPYADEIARLLSDGDSLASRSGRVQDLAARRWTWATEERKLVEFVEAVVAEPA